MLEIETAGLRLADFLKIAKYGNTNWKGSFTENEIKQNAADYFAEYQESNRLGQPTPVMQELCKLLIEDMDGGSEEPIAFLNVLMLESNWEVRTFYCEHCGKREIVFFSNEELDNLWLHEQRRMLIQEAIPEKPQWIRETFQSGLCKCPECWQKYWKGELRNEIH